MNPVDLELRDGLLHMSSLPDELLPKLRYWKREIAFNEKTHRREVQGHYEALWAMDEDGSSGASVFAGLTHRVLEFLRTWHVPFTFKDLRTPMPQFNVERAMAGLRDYQKEIVLKMLVARGGVLQAPTGLGKTFISSKLIDAYNPEDLKLRNTPISVFACPDKDITRKNYEELSKILPNREVGLVMSGVRKFSDDIQVITLDSLHLLNPDDVGIMVVDEVHTAASDSRADSLCQFTKALMYGVSATPSGRFDGKDLVTEAIFGPTVVKRTYKDGVDAGALVPIDVIWINAPEPTCGLDWYFHYKSRDGKLRAGHINNRGVNKCIADLLHRLNPDQQCLVIAQFIEHIANIYHLCDNDVRYVHAQTTEKGLRDYPEIHAISNKERKEIYNQVRSGEIAKIISSMIYRQGVDFPSLNIVVNAAGGGSDIAAAQIPGRASRKVDGKEVAYMVDFWHPWDVCEGKSGPLLACDRQRRKVYQELGFNQTWTDSIDNLSFLAPRKPD